MVHARQLIVACIVLLAPASALYAQVGYTVVANLGSVGGAAPLGGVIRGADGALYGTTSEGGAENCGIVFRLDAAGALSRIHEFSQPDGCRPVGELALGPDGALYGVTNRGGDANPQRGVGTIYKIALDGTFTVLHRLVLPLVIPPEPWLIPGTPDAGLTLAPDGFFYGTLRSSDVFRISLDGAFALVHQFSAEAEPVDLAAALVLGADGYLYSTSPNVLTTRIGAGAIFRVSLAGAAEVVYRFMDFGHVLPGVSARPEGAFPFGELAAGPDAEFYGANSSSGPSVIDRGTIFRLQPDGTLAVLHAFPQLADQSLPDGASPRGGVILGGDGYIYGTTSTGGANGNGTVFRIGRNGGLATLRSFAQDGLAPTKGRLLETAPGVFYGTAPSASGGVVYQLTIAGALLAESRILATNEDQATNGVLTATGGGPSTTFSLLTNGSRGVATIDPATGAFTYTPNPNAFGTDTFRFSVTDGARQSNIATVTVRIVEAPDPPIAVGSSISTPENTPVQATLTASDPDGAFLTFDVVTPPTKGTVDLNRFTGLFTYTPNPGVTGQDAFTFQASDGFLSSNVATVSITIVPTALIIELVAPLGGEKLFAGIPATIQWTVTGAVGIDVELSRDGGATFAAIPECAGLPGSATSCVWTPTGPRTSRAQIRVAAHNAAGASVSDVTTGAIEIATAAPRLEILYPHAPFRLKIGSTLPIWWIHNLGAHAFVRIELSRDGGATWEVIAPAVQSITLHFGAFAWLVTGPEASAARLRVTSLSTGVSDATGRFRIVTPGSHITGESR